MNHRRDPRYLKIGSTRVRLVRDVSLNDENLLGFFGHELGQPTIRYAAQPRNQQAMTWLHEALHAISDFYGLRLSEGKVRILEQSLTALLRDNPALTRSLLRKDR